jgi:putative ABC transport system substrate-binding protein
LDRGECPHDDDTNGPQISANAVNCLLGSFRLRPRITVVAVLLLLAVPFAAGAQPTGKVAFLCPGGCSNLPNPVNVWDQAFLAGLEQGGYVLGRNASIDMSGVGVGYGRLPEAAKKLVQRKVDVIISVGNEATLAARQATKSTPIVMVNVADAVDEGLVASLGRPGANVTGLSVPLGQLAAKHVELLKEINPRLARVAVLWNPRIELHQERFVRLERAVRSLGVELSALGVANFRDLEKAFGSMGHRRPDGLLLFEQLMGTVRGEIARFALQRRVVTAASDQFFAQGGGLLAYGPYLPDLYERAALYAGKLLKGARPSELPVEEPTRFELVVNRATAKALGLTIPPALLLRVDHFIE